MSTELIELLTSDLTDVTRERLMALEHAAFESDPEEFPRVESPPVHRFSDGIYSREVFIPAGTFAIGKIHRKSQMTVVLGDITVASTVEGLRRVTGCEIFTTDPGVKRAVYAHADTWWTTFHPNPTNTRDIAQLERELIAPTFAELDAAP